MTEQSLDWKEWPEGLDELSIFLVLGKAEIRLSDLGDQVKQFRAVRVSEHGITATLREPIDEVKLHGHARIRATGDDVDLQFGVYHGASSVGERGLRLNDFLVLLEQSIELENADVKALATAVLVLSWERWASTFPLPITLPGMLDSVRGSPEVAGFEFAFREANAPIRRAAISTFEGLEEYLVRLQIRLPFNPISSIFERALDATQEHAKLLVTRRHTPSEASENA